MFRPYKYLKTERVEETPKARRSLPKLPWGEIKQWGSVILTVSGLFLLGQQVVWPWLTTPSPQKPLLKPTSPSVAGATSEIKVEFEFTELASPPGPRAIEPRTDDVPEVFYLTIPKLGIEDAEVETNSENLSPDERLGHYAGSVLPGEVGNTFIYGHSVLPVFYDPKNYRTIFSTLNKLEKGDEIAVEFGERYFKYVVEKQTRLKPEDVRPLEPVAPEFLRESYLTLMTCVPMGLGTDRLLVQAVRVL